MLVVHALLGGCNAILCATIHDAPQKWALCSPFDCAYHLPVLITCDPAKNQRNMDERGLPFDHAADFNFESALIHVDNRSDYGETRYIALGFLHGRLRVLCFAKAPDGIRAICFRKANSREVSRYAEVRATD